MCCRRMQAHRIHLAHRMNAVYAIRSTLLAAKCQDICSKRLNFISILISSVGLNWICQLSRWTKRNEFANCTREKNRSVDVDELKIPRPIVRAQTNNSVWVFVSMCGRSYCCHEKPLVTASFRGQWLNLQRNVFSLALETKTTNLWPQLRS